MLFSWLPILVGLFFLPVPFKQLEAACDPGYHRLDLLLSSRRTGDCCININTDTIGPACLSPPHETYFVFFNAFFSSHNFIYVPYVYFVNLLELRSSILFYSVENNKNKE